MDIHFCLQVITVLMLSVTRVLCEQLCLEGDFDSQLRTILRNQMLNRHQIAESLHRPLKDVRNTLNKQWKNYEIIPFGSLTTGLALKTSDADYYVRIPNYNSSIDRSAIETTTRLFQQQPTLYSQLSHEIDEVYAIFTFFYIPTQRFIDIVYKFGDSGVANSRLVAYYFKLDKRFLPLGGILKVWAKIHGISGESGKLTNYAIYTLIIFYLQQKAMVPSVYVLQKHSVSQFVKNWDVSFNRMPYRSNNTQDLYQLLGDFFKYYSEFNFSEYIVSPFTGYPIQKSAFIGVDNVPQEFSLYKNHMSAKRNMQPALMHELNVNTDLCLQDPFQHNWNNAASLGHEEFSKFISRIKLAAQMFEELPRNEILKAILTVDQEDKSVKKNCIKITA